jgi:hypothetical protein
LYRIGEIQVDVHFLSIEFNDLPIQKSQVSIVTVYSQRYLQILIVKTSIVRRNVDIFGKLDDGCSILEDRKDIS